MGLKMNWFHSRSSGRYMRISLYTSIICVIYIDLADLLNYTHKLTHAYFTHTPRFRTRCRCNFSITIRRLECNISVHTYISAVLLNDFEETQTIVIQLCISSSRKPISRFAGWTLIIPANRIFTNVLSTLAYIFVKQYEYASNASLQMDLI